MGGREEKGGGGGERERERMCPLCSMGTRAPPTSGCGNSVAVSCSHSQTFPLTPDVFTLSPGIMCLSVLSRLGRDHTAHVWSFQDLSPHLRAGKIDATWGSMTTVKSCDIQALVPFQRKLWWAMKITRTNDRKRENVQFHGYLSLESGANQNEGAKHGLDCCSYPDVSSCVCHWQRF